ncbi:MAG: hypothetical protein DRP01_08730 [Archaeoglobales archaeon]|nr:MAG: hypothetical protein DRP01_08730 [Archaeoglobales archaeon]
MSVHGACFDNGQAGKCGPKCEEYIQGHCHIEDEIDEMADVDCLTCEYCDDDFMCCYGASSKRVNVESYYDDEEAPPWCPLIKTKRDKREESTMADKTFNFDGKTAQVKGNAVNALETAKNTLVTLQQGQAVVTAVKIALKKMPACPDGFKSLLDTPYGDMVVGLILHTVGPVLTGSPMVLKAVKAANVAGVVELSRSITFIQDAIEAAMAGIPGLDTLVKDKHDYRDERVKDELGGENGES